MLIGYHCSHEQFSPGELLDLAQLAESAGFQVAMASDHFSPFSLRQGESGFVWSWLGAALARTSISLGTVNAPGQRYHPAIIAQAAATLCQMFPGRFWLALGSGQLINEQVTGEPWPNEEDRNRRLLESAEAIRALLAGQTVTHDGLVTLKEARLFTLPLTPPKLLGAAITAETAAWAAGWADGLITVAQPHEELRKVVSAFRSNGGEAKPLYLQAQVSFDETYEAALMGAHDQWRMSLLPSDASVDAETPEEIDRLSNDFTPEDVATRVRVSADPDQHIEWIKQDRDLGFDAVFIHNVNRQQQRFIEVFGAEVLPALAESER
jgi:coenzyme F420-dependent glucose-6-phosphate dehydrogenase